ncbi:hypothetical protein KGF57_004362 [Candida theae]|uniref:RFX-type winged-helix domain-containing protein n=1 Tax=Candida theae TaxID=1198502 RepID=A0AAD5FX08_9ASCO|nr:uncharacterized protein KGF57_004362 [Candida theae]KAI5950300.1 hypothetical protein KGF57_004362 [Candida theae]
MPPNKPPHKRRKSSTSSQGGFDILENRQNIQPRHPNFNLDGHQFHSQSQSQSQSQAQSQASSAYHNLDASSAIYAQANFPISSNKFEEQDVYNYASYAPLALHPNANFRQDMQTPQSGQYPYNNEFQGPSTGQANRRIASTGYDRYSEYPLVSPTAPLIPPSSTGFNFQHGGSYQRSPTQPSHHFHQHQQLQLQEQSQQQHQSVRPTSNVPQQNYYSESQFGRPYQSSSSYGNASYINLQGAGSSGFQTPSSQFPSVSNYPGIDTNLPHSQQSQAFYNVNASTGANKSFSQPQPTFSTGSLQTSVQASSIASGPPSIPPSVVTTAPTPAPVAAAAAPTTAPTTAPRHLKNNLSISSHLTSISLGGAAGNMQQNIVPPNEHQIQRFHRDTNPLLDELLLELFSVDGSNMGDYLHSLICKLNTSFPLDDFYNLLYNNDRQMPMSTANFNYNQKIDKTPKNPQNFSIQRLSIFKTYFIICQKLIIRYPSSSNTANEQQKLILGQSKLGKLIKLVYPNTPIKRLGSRGESRYHYLGVVWNEHIIDANIRQLCEQYDLDKLNKMFTEEGGGANAEYNELLFPGGVPTDVHTPIGAIPTGGTTNKRGRKRSRSSDKDKLSTHRVQDVETRLTPRLSFIKMESKYPVESDFTVIQQVERQENWFSKLLADTYVKVPSINPEMIKTMLLTNASLVTESSLLENLLQLVFVPIMTQSGSSNSTKTTTTSNFDLLIYIIIILEALPILLLTKPLADINLVTNLRRNFLYLINHLPQELAKLNNENATSKQYKFPSDTVSTFLNLVKKMINLNDLLITLVKLLNKPEQSEMMGMDIWSLVGGKPVGSGLVEVEDPQPSNLMSTSSAPPAKTEDTATSPSTTNTASNVCATNLSFKNEIISSDLIHTLAAFRFNPATSLNVKSASAISSSFISEDVSLLDEFFRVDLLQFLNGGSDAHCTSSLQYSSLKDKYQIDTSIGEQASLQKILQIPQQHRDTAPTSTPIGQNFNTSEQSRCLKSILTTNEMKRVTSLLALIDTKLLSPHFKSKYPIQVFNNYITFMLNDVLKHIFIKQRQQKQTQEEFLEEGSSTLPQASRHGANFNANTDSSQSSFGSWWVFNSIVSEYLSLMGEISGLRDLLE